MVCLHIFCQELLVTLAESDVHSRGLGPHGAALELQAAAPQRNIRHVVDTEYAIVEIELVGLLPGQAKLTVLTEDPAALLDAQIAHLDTADQRQRRWHAASEESRQRGRGREQEHCINNMRGTHNYDIAPELWLPITN